MQHQPVSPPPSPPRPPSTPGEPRRLWRSRHDRRLSGVCGGIGEYAGIDPTLVRLAVVASFFAGIGLFLYPLAWLIIPKRPVGHLPPPPQTARASRTRFTLEGADRNVVIALLVMAIIATVSIGGGTWLPISLLLIGGGFWLLSQQPDASSDDLDPASDTALRTDAETDTDSAISVGPPRDPADMTDDELHTAAQQFTPYDDAPPPPDGDATPIGGPHTTDHSTGSRRLGVRRATYSVVGVLLVGWAALASAANAGGWWDLRSTRVVGIALVIVGTGIIFGALFGTTTRLLVGAGLIGLIALAPLSLFGDHINDGVGDRIVLPLTVADLSDRYEFGIGSLTLDLRNIDSDDLQGREIDVDLGAGELVVLVPVDLAGSVSADLGAGEIRIERPTGDLVYDGIGVETGQVSLPGGPGDFSLDIEVGIGTIIVDAP